MRLLTQRPASLPSSRASRMQTRGHRRIAALGLVVGLLVAGGLLAACGGPRSGGTGTTAIGLTTASTTVPQAPRPPSEGIVAYAVGDASLAGSADVTRRLAAQVPLPREGLDLFLYLGDVYPSGSAKDFAVYDSIWGATGHDLRPRTMSVLGNHESDARDEGWIPYWLDAATSGDAGSLTIAEPAYYAVKAGDWKFIALDTNHDLTVGSEQYRFLVRELEEPGFHSIAFGHHPRWSSGKHGDGDFLDDMWMALVDGGAVAYVSGHEHNSQIQPRRDRDGSPVDEGGTIQLVAGAGGAELYSFESGKGQSAPAWGDDSHYALLRLTLWPDQMAVAFIDESGNTLIEWNTPLAEAG